MPTNNSNYNSSREQFGRASRRNNRGGEQNGAPQRRTEQAQQREGEFQNRTPSLEHQKWGQSGWRAQDQLRPETNRERGDTDRSHSFRENRESRNLSHHSEEKRGPERRLPSKYADESRENYSHRNTRREEEGGFGNQSEDWNNYMGNQPSFRGRDNSGRRNANDQDATWQGDKGADYRQNQRRFPRTYDLDFDP